jgi:hypothetical protein
MGWRVRVDAVASQPWDPRTAKLIRDALQRLGVHVTFDRNGLTLSLFVQASSPHEAAQQGMNIVRRCLPGPSVLTTVRLEVYEELANAGQASAPELLGIAELAAMLGVSKQRASELARSAEFPRPRVTLKAGPVWTRASIVRYMATWQRRPGRRPRRVQAA